MNNPLKLNSIVRARTSQRILKADPHKTKPSLEPTAIRITSAEGAQINAEAVPLKELIRILREHNSLEFGAVKQFKFGEKGRQRVQFGTLVLVDENGNPIKKKWEL